MQMTLSTQQLAFLRVANPTAAFAALFTDFSAAVKADPEMAKAFASFQKAFNGKINTSEDAVQIAALKVKGADKLGIKIGALPLTFSAGLAFIYDVAVEGLRSRQGRIDPSMLSARGIHTVEHLLKPALLQIGSTSVTALELSLRDKSYAARLHQRASEIVVMVGEIKLDNSTGICEGCEFITKDPDGTEHITCLSKDECKNVGGLFLLIILILLLIELIDWLW